MSNSEPSPLREALQDLKEALLLSVAKRLISNEISDQKVIMMARVLPATEVVSGLKREYWRAYLWNRFKRRFWAA